MKGGELSAGVGFGVYSKKIVHSFIVKIRCCIIGVTFSVGLFLTAAALISVGTVVMGTLSMRLRARARYKADILPLSQRSAETMRAQGRK
jgi:hypothetical protein